MSFAKAKLQRFNEIKDCSPSPAKYNVAEPKHHWLRGGFFTKSGRFTRKDSPTRSDSESVKSTPCFQTPTAIPKKKKSLTRSLTKSSKSKDNEQLQERIVECNNKDIYIKELTEQLEELKIKLKRIEDDQQNKLIENQLLNDEIKQLKLTCNQYLNDIEIKSDENSNINGELQQIRDDYKRLQEKNREDMAQMLQNLNKFESLYNETIEESRKIVQSKTDEYEENLKKTQKQYEEDLKILTTQLEKKHVEYSQQIDEKQQKIDEYNRIQEELKKTIAEKDAKIVLLEENFHEINLLSEIQTNQKLDEIERIWQNRLDDKQNEHNLILKECQEISEYAIIETELEKNQLRSELKVNQENYEELQANHQKLTEKYQQLLSDNEQKQSQLQKYEITVKTNLDTIDVIKKRLIESDRDVEQFKNELKTCEAKFVDYENLIIDLRRQLHDCQIEKDELEMQFESTLKTTYDQIETTKRTLIEKVDSFERIISEQLEKNQQFDEIYEQFHQQQHLNQQSQMLIDQSNRLIANYENDNMKLQQKSRELEDLIDCYKNKIVLYENEIDDLNDLRKKYIDISGKYDEVQQNYEQLENKFRDLEIEKVALNDEYQQLNQKYVDILSHQNNKQKIKHICSLKADSSELFRHNLDLQKENNRLLKIIEKLSNDSNDMKKSMKKSKCGQNKENLLSPNRLPAVRTDSPGPLKEVN